MTKGGPRAGRASEGERTLGRVRSLSRVLVEAFASMSKPAFRVITTALLALLPACRGDDGTPDTTTYADDEASTSQGDTLDGMSETADSNSSSSSATDSSSSDDSSSSSDANDTSTTASDTNSATDTSETGDPLCGNAIVEGGEQCDNGPDNVESGECLPDCSFNVCGDTFVGPAEGCDDGNVADGDGCSALCLIEDLDPGVIMCGNKIYACGDNVDNDDDGLVDLEDPECISPCDDDESSFLTDLPGQNNDCKQDCYFDANSGSGDDSCEWNLKCDPENPGANIGCAYDPDFAMCELDVMQQCLDFCVPLVPNGCDCFGCCEISGQFVYLDSTDGCSLDNLEACESCTFFENCNNPCEPENCELCFGQGPEDLPPECDMASCPEGVSSCESIDDCPVGQYCQTGCCIDIQPQ
jgi:cysteine-rich repeat protein